MLTQETDRNFTLADLNGLTIEKAEINSNGVMVMWFKGNEVAMTVNADRVFMAKRDTHTAGYTAEWENNYVKEAVEGGHV